jgi:hypothetical protein
MLLKAKAAVVTQNALEATKRTGLFDSMFAGEVTPAYMANIIIQAYCNVCSKFLKESYSMAGFPGKVPMAAQALALSIRRLDPKHSDEHKGLRFALLEVLKRSDPYGANTSALDLQMILDAADLAQGKDNATKTAHT